MSCGFEEDAVGTLTKTEQYVTTILSTLQDGPMLCDNEWLL